MPPTSIKGFKYNAAATSPHYTYDLNGNLTLDKHKDLFFNYNHLNLPNSINNSADSYITLTYTADGEKLTKVASGQTRNYVAGIEYLGANLEAIYHAEGRCTPNGATAFHYEYTLKDHLGNARVNFRANGTAVTFLEEMHYYPFGMQMEGIGTQNPANKYLYNGKELNDDLGLNWYDYGARWYDAALGRWWSVDQLAEKYSNWSSYNFVKSNPIRLVDPNGMATYDYVYLDQKGEEIHRIKDNKVKQVTIVSDEKAAEIKKLKEDNRQLPLYSLGYMNAMGITYEMSGMLDIYEESAKDLVKPGDIDYNIKDGATGESRNDIAREHGAILELKGGKVTVGEKNDPSGNSAGNTVFNRPVSQYKENEVASIHTHPNEGKMEAVAGGRARMGFKDDGPSPHDKSTRMPKSGYMNIVVDKNKVHFYSGEKVISILKSQL